MIRYCPKKCVKRDKEVILLLQKKNKIMRFTQKQIYEVLGQVVSKPDGLGELLKVGLELLMKPESQIHNEEYSDSSNGCRKRIFKYNPAIAFWFNVLMF